MDTLKEDRIVMTRGEAVEHRNNAVGFTMQAMDCALIGDFKHARDSIAHAKTQLESLLNKINQLEHQSK